MKIFVEVMIMKFDSLLYNYNSRRTVVHGNRGMVATSQPLAAQAGLDILKKGGNAIDAAVATAAVLTVVEPTSNGIGGDAFAIIWTGDKIHGLNASGCAPELMSVGNIRKQGLNEIPEKGLIPITVPGIPRAWAGLIDRFGKMTLEEVLEPAIDYARNGYPLSPTVSFHWDKEFNIMKEFESRSEFNNWFKVFAPKGRSPKSGEIWKSPDHAGTLENIAATNGDSIYHGEIADMIDSFSRENNGFIRKSDLERYELEWVDPVKVNYRGYDIWELPPNGHGIVALMALNIMKNFDFGKRDSKDTFHKQIEAIKLAFADGRKYISDSRYMEMSVERLLLDEYGKERAGLIGDDAAFPVYGTPPKGGTVYLATADGQGNMVSFIQSNYKGFGSGIVIPGTGVALHNRGNNFTMDESHINCVEPFKKPYHTIIPGFMSKGNVPIGPFGVMGGFMQPQGHVQVVSNMIDFNMNPQDALDAPRWQWIEDMKVDIESEVRQEVFKELKEMGHDIRIEEDVSTFGRGQIIIRDENGVLTGATEPRADGCVAVW